jgi:glycosyltransferase involved in cell wall biosynthesis
MARDGVQVAHFPANVGVGSPTLPTVLTVHDAINLLPLRELIRGHSKRPKTMALMAYLHAATKLAIRTADLVLTVSNHAASEICRVAGIEAQRVISIPEAASARFVRISDPSELDRLHSRFGLGKSFVVADALKNPAVLIDAWALLSSNLRESHQLVFFARRLDVPPRVRQAVEAGLARLLIQPSTDDLVGLYSSCDAFVSPSWIEGFGLPVLEAMACGAPVIASDRGSLPEVVGDAALLIDPEDHFGLARLLERLLTTPEEMALLRQRGYARVRTFSWERTAKETLRAYERAACA